MKHLLKAKPKRSESIFANQYSYVVVTLDNTIYFQCRKNEHQRNLRNKIKTSCKMKSLSDIKIKNQLSQRTLYCIIIEKIGVLEFYCSMRSFVWARGQVHCLPQMENLNLYKFHFLFNQIYIREHI